MTSTNSSFLTDSPVEAGGAAGEPRGTGRSAYARLAGVADSAQAYVDLAVRLPPIGPVGPRLAPISTPPAPVLFEDMAAVTELADFFEQAVERIRI